MKSTLLLAGLIIFLAVNAIASTNFEEAGPFALVLPTVLVCCIVGGYLANRKPAP